MYSSYDLFLLEELAVPADAKENILYEVVLSRSHLLYNTKRTYVGWFRWYN